MEKCKYCESKNLILEPKEKGQDVLTADMVAIKCGDCGKWLGWCPKADRSKYVPKTTEPKTTEQITEKKETKTTSAKNDVKSIIESVKAQFIIDYQDTCILYKDQVVKIFDDLIKKV